MHKRLMKIGVIGSVTLGICCFTPLLVISLGAIGAAAIIPWLDYVLMPGMLVFLCLMAYAWINSDRSEDIK
jgi:mercuric ion transport protein